jgi:hypothetical protein
MMTSPLESSVSAEFRRRITELSFCFGFSCRKASEALNMVGSPNPIEKVV